MISRVAELIYHHERNKRIMNRSKVPFIYRQNVKFFLLTMFLRKASTDLLQIRVTFYETFLLVSGPRVVYSSKVMLQSTQMNFVSSLQLRSVVCEFSRQNSLCWAQSASVGRQKNNKFTQTSGRELLQKVIFQN